MLFWGQLRALQQHRPSDKLCDAMGANAGEHAVGRHSRDKEACHHIEAYSVPQHQEVSSRGDQAQVH